MDTEMLSMAKFLLLFFVLFCFAYLSSSCLLASLTSSHLSNTISHWLWAYRGSSHTETTVLHILHRLLCLLSIMVHALLPRFPFKIPHVHIDFERTDFNFCHLIHLSSTTFAHNCIMPYFYCKSLFYTNQNGFASLILHEILPSSKFHF